MRMNPFYWWRIILNVFNFILIEVERDKILVIFKNKSLHALQMYHQSIWDYSVSPPKYSISPKNIWRTKTENFFYKYNPTTESERYSEYGKYTRKIQNKWKNGQIKYRRNRTWPFNYFLDEKWPLTNDFTLTRSF